MNYSTDSYFLLFLPLVGILHYLLPKPCRRWVLLLSSLVFYYYMSGKLIVFLLGATVVIYLLGLWLEKQKTKRDAIIKPLPRTERKPIKEAFKKKEGWILLLGIVLLLGTLIVRKYTPFIFGNVNHVLALFGSTASLKIPKFALPLGISFYTLSAISYLDDVRQEKIKADHNPFRLCLFLCFFPYIMEGPICRYSDTAEALWEGKRASWKNITFGMQRFTYGCMKKLVIADRLDPAVCNIFDYFGKFDGGVVALGMIAYTIQLYMEFSGTMDMVLGSAEILGIKVPENFRQPFFSKSISEFWTRWHITLGTWFRDYVFYPISLSAPLKSLTTKARKKLGNHFGPLLASAVALLAVWCCNGFWHGSAWSYLFFGLYHFFWILLGSMTEPLSKQILERLHINRQGKAWSGFRIVRTVCIVLVGEMFFRANGLMNGLRMFDLMVRHFTLSNFNADLLKELKIDICDVRIAIVGVVIVFVISLIKECGIDVREAIAKKPLPVRWCFYYALLLFVVIFGAYGMNYIPVPPIYANF